MMSTGFADAPVSRSLVYGLVGASILVSITDVKHYFYIQVDPHLWRYHQIWRILIYQFCYTNSTEVLFAAMTFYNMRVIERLWGSRKYAVRPSRMRFISGVTTDEMIVFHPSSLRAHHIHHSRPARSPLPALSFNTFNYLPAGPTAIIFAVLAQYHAAIPHVYKYRIAASSSPPTSGPFIGVTLSDKSYTYLPALQLSLSQFPGSFLCAVVGWIVGYSWREDILPGSLIRHRVPGWLVGIREKKRAEDFEGMRRRLAGENSGPILATGSGGQEGGEGGRRRTLGRQLLDQFRGAL
jgi:hypothetical protein